MDDPAIIQWLVGQVGLGGLAAFALIMLRQSYQERDKIREAQIERERQDRETLVEVVKANTAAMASIREVVTHCTRGQ